MENAELFRKKRDMKAGCYSKKRDNTAESGIYGHQIYTNADPITKFRAINQEYM